MLTNTGSDDSVLLLVSYLALELLDDFLRLHQLTGLALHVGERIFLLPALDVFEPLLARRMLNQRNKCRKILDDISNDWNGGVDDLVDILGLNFEVDDATFPNLSSSPCGRCESCNSS